MKNISALIVTLFATAAFAQSNVTIYGPMCDGATKADTKKNTAATGAKSNLTEVKIIADESKEKVKPHTDEVKDETSKVAPTLVK